MKGRLYIAYGSNLNFAQMHHRCPTAKLVGMGVINDYELQFKGYATSAYATIAPKTGARVPVGVWEIQRNDERSLDAYEGYPTHYFKKNVSVRMDNGEALGGMVYIMNQRMQFGMPSAHYYQVVAQGYKDCGLDTHVLNEAVEKSAGKYYKNLEAEQEKHMQARVRLEETEDGELEEDEELDEEDLEDVDEDYTNELCM